LLGEELKNPIELFLAFKQNGGNHHKSNLVRADIGKL